MADPSEPDPREEPERDSQAQRETPQPQAEVLQLPCVPNLEEMAEVVEHLFGDVMPIDDELLELTWSTPAPGTTSGQALDNAQMFHLDDDGKATMIAWAAKKNAEPNINVYLPAGLRHRNCIHARKHRGEEHTTRVPAVWADLDEPGAYDAAKTFVIKHGFPPTMALITCETPHRRGSLWWKLDEPAGRDEFPRIKAILKRFVALLGADPLPTNPASLMRFGGGVAWPVKRGRTLEMTRIDREGERRKVPYALDEIGNLTCRALAAKTEGSASGAGAAPEPGFDFNHTAEQLDIADLVERARQPGKWHDSALRATAKVVALGMTEAEILDWLTPLFQQPGYTYAQTREELRVMVEGALKKGWHGKEKNAEGAPAPVDGVQSPVQIAGRQGRRRERTDALVTALLSQDFAALMYASRFDEKLLFDHDAGRWLAWDGAHFHRDCTEKAFHNARELARELAANQEHKVRAIAGSSGFVAGVERFARADPIFARTSEDWDQDPFLLGTLSGTVDLRTGRLKPADQADLITRITSVAPAETSDCPQWRRFLMDATARDEGLIEFLQIWSGYCLTGDISEHALVFVHGGGGNGKGVFVNVISEVMGDYAVTAAMDTFEAAKTSKHPTDLAMLRGARLVTASETEEGRAWAEARIKAMTGGDPITARFMRQDFFTYRPAFKLTIIGNHLPVLDNVDDAARRRFNIVPFLFKPKEPDKLLPEKLRAEYPAILRWMIDGCLLWQAKGLPKPKVIADATEEYFAEQDLFQQWIDDCCDVRIGFDAKFEPTSGLRASWNKYAAEAGEKVGSARSFGQKMRRRGFKPGRTGSTRFYRYISLKLHGGADPDDVLS